MAVETHNAGGNGARINGNGEGQQPEAWDFVLAILSKKWRILLVTLVFGALGVLLSLIPQEPAYNASAVVIREVIVQQNTFQMGNFLSFGQTPVGLTSEVYPSIITSREVRLAVVRDTFYFSDEDTSLTYTDYVMRQQAKESWFAKAKKEVTKYTIKLPTTLKRMASAPNPKQAAAAAAAATAAAQADTTGRRPSRPTAAEEVAMSQVGQRLTVPVDQQTGLMTISITTNEPQLSASLVSSVIRHFQARVHDMLTEKTRQNLEFTRARFEKAQRELLAAEDNLARFNDRNLSPQTSTLLTERERLTRAVVLKQQLYMQLQAEMTQAEVELQRSRPVLTVVQEPVPPRAPSGGGINFPLIGLIVGLLVGVGRAVYPLGRSLLLQDEAVRLRLEQVRGALGRRRKKQRALVEENA